MLSHMGDWRRTHNCVQLNASNIGEEVCLMGWVQRRRDHGGVIFVDLRDRAGLTQVVMSLSLTKMFTPLLMVSEMNLYLP